MPLGTLLVSTVIPWVANEIYDAYKDKYVTSGLKKFLFTPEEYAAHLSIAINSTINKYQEIYPPSGNFPFYHHKETFAQLSKYVLFNNEGDNVLKSINFAEIENIDKPTSQQVEHFYSFFIEEIQSNDKLKELYIEGNYKEKIFDIYKEVSLIKNTIEDFLQNIPNADSLIQTWIEQIYSNLQKLKSVTALEEINHIETVILPANQISNKTRAFIYFVKGLCLNDNRKPQDSMDYFEQACLLDPDHLSYRTWNLYLKYLFNNSPEVINAINIARKSYPFEPILNGVGSMEELKINRFFVPNNLPLTVQKNLRYKRIIYRYYVLNGFIEQAIEYLHTDTTDINNELNNVTIDNYGYLDFYFQLFFIDVLTKNSGNTFFYITEELRASSGLELSIGYFSKYLDQINSSEKNDLKHLYNYLLQIALFLKSGDKKHLDNAYTIFQQKEEIITPYYLKVLISCFSQAGDCKAALELYEKKELVPDDHYYKAHLYDKLNDQVSRRASIISFIQSVVKIDDHNIEIILDSVLYPTLKMEELEAFYVKISNNEISTDGVYRDIIIATKGAIDENFKDSSIIILENNFKVVSEQPIEKIILINAFCRVLHHYKLWQGIINLLGDKELSFYESKSLLIDALSYSKQNPSQQLKLLQELRNGSFPQILQYYKWEINLNCLLGEWDKVDEIVKKGKTVFGKSDIFDYYSAISLFNQKNGPEYCKLVNSINLLNFQLPNFNQLIHGLIQFKDFLSAVEATYLYATTHKVAEHRMLFFNTYLMHGDGINLSIPIFCEPGYYIVIESTNSLKIVNEIEHKAIYDKLMGKRVGDIFSVPAPMSNKETEYTIVGIQHKYEFLFDQIRKEAENPELTGLAMQSFQFTENATIEEMNQQLVDLFGESSDQRHEFVEQTINKYKANELTFLQLTRSAFSDNALDTYMAVTRSPSIGFKTIPLGLFVNKENFKIKERICIDLPSVLALSEAALALDIVLTQKLIISQHIIEYLNALLIELEKERKSKITLSVSSKGVVPFNHELMHEEESKVLTNCINWITDNCEVLTSARKLDFLVHIQGDNTTINNLVLCYVDTVALAFEDNISLISDDRTAWGMLRENNSVVSFEGFLLSCGVDDKLVYEHLSLKNHIGILIPLSKADDIALSFINNDEKEEFFLQNFSFKKSNNTQNIMLIMAVSRSIFSSAIPEEKKIDIVNKLLANLLEEMYANEGLIDNIVAFLRFSILNYFFDHNATYQLVNDLLDKVLVDNGYDLGGDEFLS